MSELIKREDAINAVEMFFKDAYIEDSDVHCTDMVYEINHIPTASPWHRVEEPPKEYGNYLAVVNGEVMEVTYSDISMRDDWNWSTCDAEGFVWIRSESVTHWMPLPEPPKEEEHGN